MGSNARAMLANHPFTSRGRVCHFNHSKPIHHATTNQSKESMHYPSAEANSKDKLDQRKALRNHSTRAECLMWLTLKDRQCGGWKFRRQQSIGVYILDFYCPELKLCVELDGNSHDYKYVYDTARTAFLQQQGITVMRFTNEQVYCNPQWVVQQIIEHYGERRVSDKGL